MLFLRIFNDYAEVPSQDARDDFRTPEIDCRMPDTISGSSRMIRGRSGRFQDAAVPPRNHAFPKDFQWFCMGSISGRSGTMSRRSGRFWTPENDFRTPGTISGSCRIISGRSGRIQVATAPPRNHAFPKDFQRFGMGSISGHSGTISGRSGRFQDV